MDHYFNPSDPKQKPTPRIQDAWKYNENVKKIALAEEILKKLTLLYRRRPIPFQTLNFNVGTQQPTHSDMIHFSSVPERFMCGVWMALEDVHQDNGPLHYYPKSHKLPFYEMKDMGIKGSEGLRMKNEYMDYSDYYEKFIAAVVDNLSLEKKTLNIKKGQALIWSANLLHGGEKINTPGSSRHSQVTHYYFENCIYYTPLFSDIAIKKMEMRTITDISTGQTVENKYMGTVIETKRPPKPTLFRKLIKKPLIKFYNALRNKNRTR
jgi:Phytanoyl-CoA dioxygenase (PhyH)